MTRTVLIIGNSGAARECRGLLSEVAGRESLRFKGFLAFEGYKGDLKESAAFDLGSDDAYTPTPSDVFVIGLGDPVLRLKVYQKWKRRGATFINLIHPFTTIAEGTTLGEGNIIGSGSFISCGVSLGNANFLNGSVSLGHDVQIGDGNFFGPYSIMLGGISAGSANAFGVRSVVLAKAKIGDGNIIAPGAFVYKGCRNNCLMAGNPALKIRDDNFTLGIK